MSVVDRLPAIRRSAEALRRQGHAERARDLLEPALDVSLDSFGPDHPDALETMRLLALTERDLGNLSAARRLLEEALAGGQYSLGDSDPLMLTMAAQLAGIAAELGNRYEARRNFEQVARVGPGVLGADHPAVAAARGYLGVTGAPAIARGRASAPTASGARVAPDAATIGHDGTDGAAAAGHDGAAAARGDGATPAATHDGAEGTAAAHADRNAPVPPHDSAHTTTAAHTDRNAPVPPHDSAHTTTAAHTDRDTASGRADRETATAAHDGRDTAARDRAVGTGAVWGQDRPDRTVEPGGVAAGAEATAGTARPWGQAAFDPAEVPRANGRSDDRPQGRGTGRPDGAARSPAPDLSDGPVRYPGPGAPRPGHPTPPGRPDSGAMLPDQPPGEPPDGPTPEAPWSARHVRATGADGDREPAGGARPAPTATEHDGVPDGSGPGRHAVPDPMVGPVRLSTGTGIREPMAPPPTPGAAQRDDARIPGAAPPGEHTAAAAAPSGDGPGAAMPPSGHGRATGAGWPAGPGNGTGDHAARGSGDHAADDGSGDHSGNGRGARPGDEEPYRGRPFPAESTERGTTGVAEAHAAAPGWAATDPRRADPGTGPRPGGWDAGPEPGAWDAGPEPGAWDAEPRPGGWNAEPGRQGDGDAVPGQDLIYRPDGSVATTRRPATPDLAPWTDRRPVPVSHAAPRHGPRAVVIALVAIGVLAVASAGAAAGTWLATRRGPAPPAAVSPAPYLPPPPTVASAPPERLAAPTGVLLRDGGSTVTLSWHDPSGGTVPVLIAGGHAGQTMRAFQTVDPGVDTYTVRGLNPSIDYCFTVVAVYATDRLGTSDLACTSRHTPAAGPTT